MDLISFLEKHRRYTKKYRTDSHIHDSTNQCSKTDAHTDTDRKQAQIVIQRKELWINNRHFTAGDNKDTGKCR